MAGILTSKIGETLKDNFHLGGNSLNMRGNKVGGHQGLQNEGSVYKRKDKIHGGQGMDGKKGMKGGKKKKKESKKHEDCHSSSGSDSDSD